MIDSDFTIGFKQGQEHGKQIILEKIEDIKAELRQEIANPPEGSDYEYGRVDAFNDVLNLIDEHIGGDADE